MKTIYRNFKIILIVIVITLLSVIIKNPIGSYTFKLTTLDTSLYTYGFNEYRGAPLPFLQMTGSTYSTITTPDVIIESPIYNPPTYSPIAFILNSIVIFLVIKIIISLLNR